MNALLGSLNLVLRVVADRSPRAVVLAFGLDAALYRTDAFAPYHADRPPVPDDLVPQFADADDFFGAFGWYCAHTGRVRGRRPAALICAGRGARRAVRRCC